MGLVTLGSLIGLGTEVTAMVKSGLMKLLFLVQTPLCTVFKLYDLPSGVGALDDFSQCPHILA